MRLRELFALLLVVATTAVLMRVPILAVPSYEPGLVVGALSAALLCALAARRALTRPAHASLRWGLLAVSPGEGVLAEARASARLGALMVGLPLAVLLSEGLRSECRLSAGPWAYLLIALPAAFLGASLGTFLGTISRRRRTVVTLAMLVVLLSILAPLLEALAGPRTIVHSIFLGPVTASGFMGYDTQLTFPVSAYLHRAWSLIVASGLLVLAALIRCRLDAPDLADGEGEDAVRSAADSWESSKLSPAARARFLLRHHERSCRSALVVVSMLALPFLLAADRCGLLPGQGALERELSSTSETEHFRIHYAPGSSVEAHLPRLAVELEWSREQVCSWLDIQPAWKVDAWIHPDADTLFELTGARGFLFAKPWRHEFHGVLARGRLPSLRHELVHVMAADFAPPPFRASFAMGFTEGLATALDEGYAREPGAHVHVAAAARAGHVPRIDDLLGVVSFGGTNMDVAYRSSASVIGWLLLEKGAGPIKQAYGSGRLARACGVEPEALEAGWRDFLLTRVHPSPSEDAAARQRFDPARHPAFFRTRCARLGEIAPFGTAERAALLAREGFPDEAADLFCSLPDAQRDPEILESAAFLRARAGEWAQAQLLATTALAASAPRGPRIDLLQRLRFRLLALLGRVDEARAVAEEWRASGLARWPDEIDLELQALSREDLRERYFSAALSGAPADARALGELLAADPNFAPTLNLVLDRLPPRWPLPPFEVGLAESLAEKVPGTLAARRLLELARAAEDGLDWETSRLACEAVLNMPPPGATPLQRLEAEDSAGRAAFATEGGHGKGVGSH